MEMIHQAADFILHLDRHLVELLAQHGAGLYGLLFVVIFAETGLVVTPFLPGDSLLFAIGALAAVDTSHTLTAPLLWGVLGLAAVLGNVVNYSVGRALGTQVFSGQYRLIRRAYLEQTTAYFARHGAATIVLSRFAPIVRTFAPFVAGVGNMPYARFFAYNLVGGIAWVGLFIWGGYLFGNLPPVRAHFGLVTLAILVVSLVPLATMIWKDHRGAARS